jgi:thiamine biosynthesis lipoprotein
VGLTRLTEGEDGWLGTFEAMAGPCEVHVAIDDRASAARVLDLVASEAWRIEEKYSRYRNDNIVHKINSSAGSRVRVDEETGRLLDYAASLHNLSDGRFDITSGVLRTAWIFDGSDRLPSAAQVDAALARVGWHRVQWNRPFIRLEAGMQIDFGGIGKEYAVDRAAALVAPHTQACLINFGGDLRALGPHRDGRPWQIGIEAVASPRAATRVIEVLQGGIATSGDTRRYLLKDGQRYGHILDPRTGWPVHGAPRSVTVVAATCTDAGMLATLAMLNGSRAEAFLKEQGSQYWCTS